LVDIIYKNQAQKQVIEFTEKLIVPKSLATIISCKKDELINSGTTP
jgi:hypothetical protein